MQSRFRRLLVLGQLGALSVAVLLVGAAGPIEALGRRW